MGGIGSEKRKRATCFLEVRRSHERPDLTELELSSEKILALALPELEFARQWPNALEFIGPMLYTPPIASAEPEFRPGFRRVLISLGTHLAWHKNEFARWMLAVGGRSPRH
jgi:UDP:flavonoid glycosyltransferase YjiC (YdhE family)